MLGSLWGVNIESMKTLDWELINRYETSKGRKLEELLKEHKVLLIFLRHLGCTYCRKVVSEFSKEFVGGETEGFKPVFIHMAESGRGEQFFTSYDLSGIDHISDPNKVLYQEFSLKRGSLMQLMGPQVLIRGAVDLLRFGIGKLEGDGFQMHGAFLLEGEGVQKSLIPKHVAEPLNLKEFSR